MERGESPRRHQGAGVPRLAADDIVGDDGLGQRLGRLGTEFDEMKQERLHADD